MRRISFLATIVVTLTVLFGDTIQAQQTEAPSKIEVGIQFSSLTFPGANDSSGLSVSRSSTEAGFGGRFTFNLNKNIALEAEGNFFPHNNFYDPAHSGTLWQGQFGLKAGKRFGKFGLFAKARPGVASFSKTVVQIGTTTIVDQNGQTLTFPVFGSRRKTDFSMDLGGVLEFYPSRRVLTRLDVGDTIIHYGTGSGFPVGTSSQAPAHTDHNLQVSAGIGFRFGSLQPEETAQGTHAEKLKRFEVGGQFSSLGLQQVEHNSFGVFLTSPTFRDVVTQPGFGGRFTYNLTRSFALEVQSDFYPKDNFFVNNGRAGGRILQGQAGIKAGKRFEKFGLFAKARPGLVSFSKGIKVEGLDPTFGFPIFRQVRKNYISMDVGGVLEFYPTRRLVTRFDGGDTMIHYHSIDIPISFFPLQTFNVSAETIHSFQFSAGVGYRF